MAATLTGIACPSASRCTAVDNAGQELTFDPRTPHRARARTIVFGPRFHFLDAVACPSSRECVAVDRHGSEITFDPAAPGHPRAIEVDRAGYGSGYPTPTLTSVACPAATQCTAADDQGDFVTFDPLKPRRGDGENIDQPDDAYTPPPSLPGIACPTVTQCTAVDAYGDALTFNPRTNGAHLTNDNISTEGIRAIACVEAARCVAVDDTRVFSFNTTTSAPLFGANGIGGTKVEHGAVLSAIACPAATLCAAVDSGGAAIVFDPAVPSSASTTQLGRNAALLSIACPSSIECIAVGGNDTELKFNPSTVPGDPLIEQAKLITGSKASSKQAGFSVALNGNTAVVGAPQTAGGNGAAFVFERLGSTWAFEGLLRGGDGAFGRSVALAGAPSDQLAVVGAPYDARDRGAVWLFTLSASSLSKSGLEAWSGERVVADRRTGKQDGHESGDAEFGWSVALGSGGSRALVGGPLDTVNGGAAWVLSIKAPSSAAGFSLTGEDKLTAPSSGSEAAVGDAFFGGSVALDPGADQALIGGLHDDKNHGAVWAFSHNSKGWKREQKLTAPKGSGTPEFGTSVAAYPNDSWALIGGQDGGQHDAGSAWLFKWSSGSQPWTESQGLAPTTSKDAFVGTSVALTSTSSGPMGAPAALLGAPGQSGTPKGAVWLYTKGSSGWTEQQELRAPASGSAAELGGAFFGQSISGQPGEAAVGGYNDNAGTGAAWVFGFDTPGLATGVNATPGNDEATVSFGAAPGNGSPITHYTVTATEVRGAITTIPPTIVASVTGPASPITVSGLTNGATYDFSVSATNAYGTGAPSPPSNQVTPAGPPSTPTGVSASRVQGDATSATVSFTGPADNGSPIMSYTATAVPTGPSSSSAPTVTGTGSSSPITLTGLELGAGYSITVTATNGVGTGPPSSPPATIPSG